MKNRNISFDFCRILSAFAIVILHTSAVYIKRCPVDSVEFGIANFYDSLSRFGIPMFVMISGAIFLSEEKQITVKKLWLRNILRMLIIFCIWSFAYYFYQCKYEWNVSIFHNGIVGVIAGCVYASNHFWFIFMIIGLYAIVPLLRSFLKNATEKELKYFVILFFLFQIVRNTITILADKSLITEIMDKFTIVELSGYLGYFVLGYILNKYDISKKWKRMIYASLPVCFLINYLVSEFMSKKQGTYHPGIYDSFGIFTFVISIAIFLFFKELGRKITKEGKLTKLVSNVSLDTLGIYLLHVGVLNYLEKEEILFKNISALAGVPLISFGVFIFCMVVSAVLRRIKYIGRYLA